MSISEFVNLKTAQLPLIILPLFKILISTLAKLSIIPVSEAGKFYLIKNKNGQKSVIL